MSNGARQIFEQFAEGGWPAVVKAVADGREETLHLDFKTVEQPRSGDLQTNDKKNFSTALSGFANAEGGVVIWGIDARADGNGIDRAINIDPIENLDGYVGRLKELTPEYVSPAVDGVQHIPIEKPDEAGTGVVLTFIPHSDRTPHMARGPRLHRFYRRANDTFRMMERDEIADMFGRRPQPRIEIEHEWKARVINSTTGMDRATAELAANLFLANRGRGVARFPAITIHAVQPDEEKWKVRYSTSTTLLQGSPWSAVSNPAGSLFRHAAGADVVVFPNDRILVGHMRITIANGANKVPSPVTVTATAHAVGSVPFDYTLAIGEREMIQMLERAFAEAGFSFALAE